MSVWESIRIAFSSIMAHKMRALLTMLGIIIGVSAVIAIVAIGQGGEKMLQSQISGPGNTIDVYYQPSDEEMQANPNIWLEPAFTQDDIRLLEEINDVKQVVTSSTDHMPVSYRDEQLDVSIYGINQAYVHVHELEVEQGQLFTDADYIGGRRAAVISASIQEELFNGQNPVGEVIRLGQQPIEIIGVLSEPSGLFALGLNEVYIPFQTWGTLQGNQDINEVAIQVSQADALQSVGEAATDVLNHRHDTEAYQVLNMEEIAEGISQITQVMTIIIGSIAGISLLVGGIGVMNIMLVSVTERTREIGIRKSIGATRKQILFQFLVESVTLTLIGGTIGIGLGVGGAFLVSALAGWPSLVSWPVIVGGLLFSMLIGMIFGLLPASKAAKLDPIDSLRYE